MSVCSFSSGNWAKTAAWSWTAGTSAPSCSPAAEVKFYLDAAAEERGRRRYLELKAKGMDVDPAQITQEIRDRDRQDSTRSLAPLRRADDALLIDSTSLTIDEVLERMLSHIAKVT